jgi:hypothetical protein
MTNDEQSPSWRSAPGRGNRNDNRPAIIVTTAIKKGYQ